MYPVQHKAIRDKRDSSTDDWYEKPRKINPWIEIPTLNNDISLLESDAFIVLEFPDYIPYSDPQPIEEETQKEDIEQRFYRLANEWRKETSHISSMTKLVMHPKYQSIIGMGPAVLPILFRELQENPDHWFWALKAITEADPTLPEDAGDIQKMREAWLNWAKERGYL